MASWVRKKAAILEIVAGLKKMDEVETKAVATAKKMAALDRGALARKK